MKYLIIGAGGTGGAAGAYMMKAGKDVTFIARGEHLKAMKEKGLRVIRPEDEFTVSPVKAFTMEEYNDTPDVIFVCVKGYSIKETVPFIKRVAGPDTIVIPLLNIYGTGEAMQPHLPDQLVTDGCIYIASEVSEPGVLLMKGYILRIIFGVRNADDYRPELKQIEQDLNDSEILGVLSDNIKRDALLKFSYVSAQSTCGMYYDVPTGPIKEPGEIRDCFAALISEINTLANAMGIFFEEDIVARNLKILDDITPDMTTSMQRDIYAGRASEIDGQIYEVVRMADKYGVELPTYRKIAAELKKKY
jgi:2-dehydropantoate 2-reductase